MFIRYGPVAKPGIVFPWLGKDSGFKSRPVHFKNALQNSYTADLHGNKEFYKKLIDKEKDVEIRALVIGGELCPRKTGIFEESINYQKRTMCINVGSSYPENKLNSIIMDIDNPDTKYMEL